MKKGLRGRRRAETERLVALRSHDLFEADCCRPGVAGAHEKGGIEGGVGRFRRHHLVPVPQVKDIGSLHRYLRAAGETDDQRALTGRVLAVAAAWSEEQARLRPLPAPPFATAAVSTCRVDSSARIRVRTHHSSVPVRRVGKRVEVRVHAKPPGGIPRRGRGRDPRAA